jgi:hypothetical protein
MNDDDGGDDVTNARLIIAPVSNLSLSLQVDAEAPTRYVPQSTHD